MPIRSPRPDIWTADPRATRYRSVGGSEGSTSAMPKAMPCARRVARSWVRSCAGAMTHQPESASSIARACSSCCFSIDASRLSRVHRSRSTDPCRILKSRTLLPRLSTTLMAGTLAGRWNRSNEGQECLILALPCASPSNHWYGATPGTSVPYDEFHKSNTSCVHMYPRFSTVCPHLTSQIPSRPALTGSGPTSIPLPRVDAFAFCQYAGNPGGVCLPASPADPTWIQAVAAEISRGRGGDARCSGGHGDPR